MAVFATVLVALDFAIGMSVRTLLYSTDSFWGPNRSIRILNAQTPGLVMGNSRAGLIDPDALEEAIGIPFYNATAPGQGIDFHLILLDALIRNHKKPSVIVYELDRHDVIDPRLDAEGRPVEILSFLYDGSSLAREILAHEAPGNKARYLSKLYQINGVLGPVLVDLFFRDHRNRVSRDDGFTAQNGVLAVGHCGDDSGINDDASERISDYRLELLERFVQIAEENSIRVFFTTAPVYLDCAKDYSNLLVPARRILDEHDVPYMDMLGELQSADFFYDTNHLNIQGSEIYSRRVSEWVAELVK